MKNILKFFSLSVLLSSTAFAQGLIPGGGDLGGLIAEEQPVTVNYSALNISQDNTDARNSGARPGDILRFEIDINSSIDVMDFTPTLDISGILNAAVITDPGNGSLAGNSLVFPTINNGIAPFSESHVFFARISEKCGGSSVLMSQALFGNELLIPLKECDQTGGEGACYGPNGCGKLISSGPETSLIAILLGFIGVFTLGMLIRKKRKA